MRRHAKFQRNRAMRSLDIDDTENVAGHFCGGCDFLRIAFRVGEQRIPNLKKTHANHRRPNTHFRFQLRCFISKTEVLETTAVESQGQILDLFTSTVKSRVGWAKCLSFLTTA